MKGFQRVLGCLLLVGFFSCALVSVAALPARADTKTELGCRRTARSVNADAMQMLSATTPDKSAWEELWTGAYKDHPECLTELRAVYNWLQAGAASGSVDSKTFPYPSSSDPHPGWLGPVGWWWNTVFHGLLNGNALLMLIFGWEVFLLPMGPALFILVVLWTLIRAPFRSKNRLA